MQSIRILSLAVPIFLLGLPASAQALCALPYQLTNGQTADASQVMANFAALANCAAAPAGTTNAVQVNAGSGALGGIGPLGDGQLLIGVTGNTPVAAALTAGTGISITTAPGSITISAGSGGAAWDRNSTFNPPTTVQFPAITVWRYGKPASQLTIADQPWGMVWTDTQPATNGWISVSRSIPGTPGAAFDFFAKFQLPKGRSRNTHAGLYIGDGTNFLAFEVLNWNTSPNAVFYLHHGNASSYSDDYYGTPTDTDNWLRVHLDGAGGLQIYSSVNGRDWTYLNPTAGDGTYVQTFPSTISSYFTGVPSQYGFFYGADNVNERSALTIPFFGSTEFPPPP